MHPASNSVGAFGKSALADTFWQSAKGVRTALSNHPFSFGKAGIAPYTSALSSPPVEPSTPSAATAAMIASPLAGKLYAATPATGPAEIQHG